MSEANTGGRGVQLKSDRLLDGKTRGGKRRKVWGGRREMGKANRYDLFENRPRLNEPARPCKILLTAPMNPIGFRHCISRHRQKGEGVDGEMDR